MYYMLTVILKKYVSHKCMSYIAKKNYCTQKIKIHYSFFKLSADKLMI